MRTTEIAELLVDWAREACPILRGGYDEAVGVQTVALPNIAVEIQNIDPSIEPTEQFPVFNVQQAYFRSRSYNLVVLVKDDDQATDNLSNIVDDLFEAIYNDITLGGRVPRVGILPRPTFNPPFVEFDDRTRGRAATIELQVGELIDPEE